MTYSHVDWVVMWRLFHHQFFWIYLALGVPLRLLLVLRFDASSASKKALSVAVAAFASAIVSTWLPIVPIVCVGVLDLAFGVASGESLLIGAPLVAVSMGIETALADVVLFRMVLKESVKKRLGLLLLANILNASLALAIGLAWAFRHMPIFLAAVDR